MNSHPNAILFLGEQLGELLLGAMLRIIVADEQELYRAGIRALLESTAERPIVSEAPDWPRLMSTLNGDYAALVIASVSLGADLKKLISSARVSNSAVLLVADDTDSLNFYRSTGASGAVHRSAPASQFLETVKRVLQGDGFVLHAAGAQSLQLGSRLANSLTLTEVKILTLLMEGLKTRLIAEHLNLAEYAVRAEFQKIFDKTGFSNRLELALFLSSCRTGCSN